MTPKPAQASSFDPPASTMSFRARGGFSPGSGAYLRLGIVGFIVERGVDIAVCTPIEKNGSPSKAAESRETYYVPVAQLIPGPQVAEELRNADALPTPAGGG